VRGEDGVYRVFYQTASRQNILVFHAFVKKAQRTPAREIRLAQTHRRGLLDAQD
jgi:phage-related protein